MCADLVATGYPSLIFKSDQEPAILELTRAAVDALRSQVNVTVQFEESPVAASAANAHVERPIWEVEVKTRAPKH